MLAVATWLFRGFINSPDFQEQRQQCIALLIGFAAIGAVGGAVGCLVWLRMGFPGAPWHGFLPGAIFSSFLLAVALFVSKNPIFAQVTTGVVLDAVLPRMFGEKTRRKKHLPELLLLQHWRDHGDLEKAWAAAQAHLFKEPRALPLWLFAMETSVLHRRKPEDALFILRRLCAAEEFHYDHRTVAVAKMQGWMAAAGFPFDSGRFKIERPPLHPAALTNKVEQLCRDGRFNEAAFMLREVLRDDSLNEEAFVQLVRICAQDLKSRPEAQKLIDEAADTFSPKLLDFLNRSLDEWIQAPSRSRSKRKSFLGRLFGEKKDEKDQNANGKISVLAPPITRPPASPEKTDPMRGYLDRVKATKATSKDTAMFHDRAEKLLLERRLGTAVELLKEQAESQPHNFEIWLRYAEAHGEHCGDIHAAQKIVEKMERSGHFKKAELKKVYSRLKKWRKKHTSHNW